MKYDPLSRRLFLQGMGGYLLSIPLLPSLMPSFAQAQTVSNQKFSMIFSPMGRDITKWYPNVTDAQLTQVPGALVKALSEVQGPISGILGTGFDNVRNKMSILRGLDSMNYVGMHNSSIMSTGSSVNPDSELGFGYSIDCVLEESAKFYPVRPMVGAIRTAPSPTDNTYADFATLSYTSKIKRGQALGREWNPQIMYNKMLNPANVQLLASKNVKLLGASNLVMENFKQTMNSRKISAADKGRLDNYMALITDLDKSLAVPPVQCGGVVDPGLQTSAGDVHRAMFKLEAAALSCGVSRIAMHAITHCGDFAAGEDWHGHAHGGFSDINPVTKLSYQQGYNKWTMDLVAYYLNLLNSISDGNGTLLDNTLVVYGNEDSTGGHAHYDLPVVIAGSTNKFKHGYLVDYRPRPLVSLFPGDPMQTLFAGRPYNNVLITAFKSMGLTEADYQKFGLQGFGRYDAYRPDLANHYAPFLGAGMNATLPFIYG